MYIVDVVVVQAFVILISEVTNAAATLRKAEMDGIRHQSQNEEEILVL